MPDTNKNYEVGFGKPPSHSRFIKGKSGNPKGRPKGSKNLATIFHKIGNERVTVTENGRSRAVTKKEAIVLQLTNKALSGNLPAMREHFRFTQLCEAAEQPPSPDQQDADQMIMANMLKRMQQTEKPSEDADQQQNSAGEV